MTPDERKAVERYLDSLKTEMIRWTKENPDEVREMMRHERVDPAIGDILLDVYQKGDFSIELKDLASLESSGILAKLSDSLSPPTE